MLIFGIDPGFADSPTGVALVQLDEAGTRPLVACGGKNEDAPAWAGAGWGRGREGRR